MRHRSTRIPKKLLATLNSAFKCLGYVSEDGFVNADKISTETIKAWGGDVVATPQTEYSDSFKFKLIEALNVKVLKTVYGTDNVSGNLSTGITINVNGTTKKKAATSMKATFSNLHANISLIM